MKLEDYKPLKCHLCLDKGKFLVTTGLCGTSKMIKCPLCSNHKHHDPLKRVSGAEPGT